ncbi:hypothetical protein DITRI_Ditri08aG0091300 [Diplodiscus trichospermus]
MAFHYLSTLILPLFLITFWSLSSDNIFFQARNLQEVILPAIPELPKPELPELLPFPKVELPPLPEFPELPKPELPKLPEFFKPTLPATVPTLAKDHIPDPKLIPSHLTTTP